MCGIYGKIRWDGRAAGAEDAERACDGLRHRGPDDRGVLTLGEACLGHTRLSIIDLSPQGHQPMSNEDETLWIVFNGEIYNFRDLRPGLEERGHRFRSRTDTEVILHLFEENGPSCLERLRGMFAIAIWDRKEKTLFLARDRVGKKPIFYYPGKDFFAFCSELAPLVSDPEIRTGVDRVAIHHYLTFQSVPAPHSAFAGVRKLPPGHWMRVREGREELRKYWKLSFTPKHPADTAARRGRLEEELLEKIREAVRIRMESDVPLGALLSGGVDSGGIVALMARHGSRAPVKTFSVGFEEKEYDELRHAREVALLYRTEHTESMVRPDVMAVLPLLVERFGEPFADPAAVPMYHIARVAREHVTVALCGDGGDENFAGYHRYKLNALLRWFDAIPPGIAMGLFRMIRALPETGGAGNALWVGKRLLQTFPLRPEIRNLRFYGHFDEETKRAIYTPEFAASMAGVNTDDMVLGWHREAEADNFLDATLSADIHGYLPNTLLAKADISSMANSLELRSPLLDHELMEFSARLPADMKLRRLTTKYTLKRVFSPLLPPGIAFRRKMGFGVPLDRWYRGVLRDMVRDTLLSRRAMERGYFREEVVRRMLDEHQAGRWRWHGPIYSLLMLELWHRRFIDR